MQRKIYLSEQEITDIRIARNYFGENDKTPHEHMLYAILDNLLEKINGDTEKRVANCECETPYFPTGNIKHCSRCDKPTVY